MILLLCHATPDALSTDEASLSIQFVHRMSSFVAIDSGYQSPPLLDLEQIRYALELFFCLFTHCLLGIGGRSIDRIDDHKGF